MKLIKYKKLAFLSDLGGIKTIDNLVIKKGLLFRSSILSKIDEKELKKLFNDLKIKSVLDLRSPSELSEVKDVIVTDINYLSIPILSSLDNPSINRQNRKAILKTLMKKEGGTLKHLSDVYRMMVSKELAINGYKEYFNYILNTNDAVLFHCTQGKDRTGMVTILTLLALGVDINIVKEEYLAYNLSCKFKNFWINVGITILKLSPHMANSLIKLLSARCEYFDAAIDEINSIYGGINNYFNLIGLTSEKIEILRKKYLE